jgi:hypothetical protein
MHGLVADDLVLGDEALEHPFQYGGYQERRQSILVGASCILLLRYEIVSNRYS